MSPSGAVQCTGIRDPTQRKALRHSTAPAGFTSILQDGSIAQETGAPKGPGAEHSTKQFHSPGQEGLCKQPAAPPAVGIPKWPKCRAIPEALHSPTHKGMHKQAADSRNMHSRRPRSSRIRCCLGLEHSAKRGWGRSGEGPPLLRSHFICQLAAWQQAYVVFLLHIGHTCIHLPPN